LTNTFDIAPFVEAESDRITADDLIAGPRTFTIARIEGTMAEGKRRMVVHLAGSPGKPFMPCKGMVRLLGQIWGPDAAQWVGRGITLFRDPDVRFGADLTGGVRIAAVTHIDSPQNVSVRASQKKIKGYNIKPMAAPAPETDAAKEAANKILANIARAPDAAKLDAYLTGNAVAGRVADWRRDRPELVAAIDAAVGARKANFGGLDDDPFSEQEGGAQAQEAEESAPPSDWKARIDACDSLADLGRVESDWLKARDDHDAPSEIDAAFEAMRNALKRSAAA
jgi:hypothetical protein